MSQSDKSERVQEIIPVESYAPLQGSLLIKRVGWMRRNRRFRLEKINIEYNLHFVRAGRGRVVIDGKPFEMAAGDVFMFYPNRHALYYDYPGEPWEYLWVALAIPPSLEWALETAGLSEDAPCVRPPPESEIWELVPKLHRQVKEGACGELFATAAAWRVLELLCEAKAAPERPLAERIKSFVDAADKAPSVKEMALRFGISRATVHRAFTAATGAPLKSYMMERRFKEACELLSETGFDVAQIAEACGFSSPQYFCRAFKARFGASPGAWRDAKG